MKGGDNIFDNSSFVKFSKEFLKTENARSKLILVMAYLRIYAAINGSVNASINIIVNEIGCKPDYHKNKVNDKIINALDWLESNNHIFILGNIHKNKFSHGECFKIQINDKNNIFDVDTDFVILEEKEFNKLIESKTKIDKHKLLNVFLNIKKYMSFDKERPTLCYPSHKTLCNDCKVSSTGAMNNIISELVAIGLLFTYNSGQYIDNKGNVKFANNFYALQDGVLKPELCDDIIKGYYSNQGITISKFIRENN